MHKWTVRGYFERGGWPGRAKGKIAENFSVPIVSLAVQLNVVNKNGRPTTWRKSWVNESRYKKRKTRCM